MFSNRKAFPLYEGLFKYFPDALWEVANASYVGSQQHHPGEPAQWDKALSTDEYDALLRHLSQMDSDLYDDDGVLHAAKVAWRALAGLQRYCDRRKEIVSDH